MNRGQGRWYDPRRSRGLWAALVSMAFGWAAPAGAADSRHSLSLQGVMRDHSGALQSMPVGLTIGLYAAKDAASPFFVKSIPTVAVDDGLFSVELADAGLSFDADDVWVGIQVSGDSSEMPRQHITAVPYSWSAAAADRLSSACQACVESGMIKEISGGKEVTFPQGTLTTTNNQLAGVGTVTLAAPGPGTLLVTAGSGNFVFFNHNPGVTNVATCCISQTAGQTGVCDPGAMEYRINPDTPASQSPFSYPLAITRAFPITQRGTVSATLYCTISGGNNGGYVSAFNMQAIYLPGRY